MTARNSLLFIFLLACSAAAQNPAAFPPLVEWKSAVLSGDSAKLKSLYSVYPAAEVNTTSGKTNADADVEFWMALKPKDLNINVVEFGSPKPGLVALTAQCKVISSSGHVTNIVVGQTWLQRGIAWQLLGVKRDIAKLPQPASVSEKIYPTSDAHEQIREALERAGKAHKNILVIFGADWCYDCHVLEKAFVRPDVAAVLKPNYEIVRVDIGTGDRNTDIASQFDVPLDRGVPAIAVLSGTGKLLYSQKNGEWERARALGPDDLIAFLNKWKPVRN